MNSYLDRQARQKIGQVGRRAEARTAKRLKMALVPASGAMAGVKGDMKSQDVLAEAKATSRDTITLKLDWLAKITHEAAALGKAPALAISFVDPTGKPRPYGAWVAIEEPLFRELMRLARAFVETPNQKDVP